MKRVFLLIFLLLLLPQKVSAEPKDFFGRNIKLPKNINRIVSLSPATTEILFSLGLESKIVGVTNDCNYPKQALGKAKTGKFGFINFEKVVSLKPDIIFATADMNKQLSLLEKYKSPLIAVKTTNINSIYQNIVDIGKITNSEKKALQIKKDFDSELKKIRINSKLIIKKSIFYCIWHDPIITAGNGSFINDIINIIGAENIAKDINNPFAKYNTESLIAKNPDYIFIPTTTYNKIKFDSLPWNKLKAVKNKKVYSVNDDIYLRPAPRIIIAIKEMQKIISINQK